ncbi:unnamed protein product, partial [Closterium sp. Yama58-4]
PSAISLFYSSIAKSAEVILVNEGDKLSDGCLRPAMEPSSSHLFTGPSLDVILTTTSFDTSSTPISSTPAKRRQD